MCMCRKFKIMNDIAHARVRLLQRNDVITASSSTYIHCVI